MAWLDKVKLALDELAACAQPGQSVILIPRIAPWPALADEQDPDFDGHRADMMDAWRSLRSGESPRESDLDDPTVAVIVEHARLRPDDPARLEALLASSGLGERASSGMTHPVARQLGEPSVLEAFKHAPDELFCTLAIELGWEAAEE